MADLDCLFTMVLAVAFVGHIDAAVFDAWIRAGHSYRHIPLGSGAIALRNLFWVRCLVLWE